MKWAYTIVEMPDGTLILHVWPDDGRDHLMGTDCWCGPKLETVPDGLQVTHNPPKLN